MPAQQRAVRTACSAVALVAAAIATSTSVSSHTGVVAVRPRGESTVAPLWMVSVRTETVRSASVSREAASTNRRLAAESPTDGARSDANAGVLSARTTTPIAVTAPPVASPPPQPAAPATQRLAVTAAAPSYWNRLVTTDGSVNTGVGVYSDCSGSTPLARYEAAIDTCFRGVTYVVGHNPGVFTGLLSESVGSTLTYWDGAGTPHHLVIIGRRQWVAANGNIQPLAGATYEFQTCLDLSGSVDWIFDAVAV